MTRRAVVKEHKEHKEGKVKPAAATVPRKDKPAKEITCYNCREDGHSSRNCTKPRMCFFCGGTDHNITTCSQVCCAGCRELGHTLRACPKGAATPSKGEGSKCVECADAAPVLIVEGWWTEKRRRSGSIHLPG
jgi:hypothetical protein